MTAKRHSRKLLAARIILPALIVAMTTGSARADDANSILKTYVAWRGGDAFIHMRNVSERGIIHAEGMQGPLERAFAEGGRYRAWKQLPAYSELDVTAGEEGWTTNLSGQVVEIGRGEAGDNRHLVAIQFADLLAGNVERDELKPESRDGRQWSIVRIRFGSPDSYDFFISSQTGELDGIRVTEDLKTRFIKYADWKKVDGVRMPFSEVVAADNTGETDSIAFSEIGINVPLAPSTFDKPVQKNPVSRFSGAGETEWIPFEFFNKDRIFFPATINGHKTIVLLDSGADSSALDTRFATSIGAVKSGTAVTVGAAGNQEAGYVGNVSIEIGNLRLAPLTVATLDLSGLSSVWAHDFGAILGREAFNDLIVDIDFPHTRIAFRSREGYKPPADAHRLTLGQYLAIMTVPVSIDGGPEVQAMFDLGNGSALTVGPAYPGRDTLLQTRPRSLELGGGIGGAAATVVSSVGTLSIGGFEFGDVPAHFPELGTGIWHSDRIGANVGIRVFERFRLICDAHDNLLYLIPDRNLLSKPFERDKSGLQFTPKADGWHVYYVAPGSPGEKEGFKSGDTIVAINGRPVGEISSADVQGWRSGALGDSVTLTLAGGAVHALHLQAYF